MSKDKDQRLVRLKQARRAKHEQFVRATRAAARQAQDEGAATFARIKARAELGDR
jgi:hypothetical protein